MSKTYAITGCASGIGKETAALLRSAGHTIIGIDKKDAEVIADLSTAEGRRHAIDATLQKAGNRLDGAVLAAGLGPIPGTEKQIAEVNFNGVVDLLEAWRHAFAASGNAHVVAFSSNSSTIIPAIPKMAVDAFLLGHADRVPSFFKLLGYRAAPMVYGASKLALARWVRQTAIKPQWAGAGIRLNALAPGGIMTPLIQAQFDSPNADDLRSLPTPIAGFGQPCDIAAFVEFLLSSHADFMTGSVLFIDGGTDAYFRTKEWPKSTSVFGTISWFLKQRAWKRKYNLG
ncbi:MAG: SDR family oxidoreductase [Termitinemataceae bacterium]|nr:MAG: SDR family oxidoreductase [Termitinemataceae bacterium]